MARQRPGPNRLSKSSDFETQCGRSASSGAGRNSWGESMGQWIVIHATEVSIVLVGFVVAPWLFWAVAVRPVRHDVAVFARIVPVMEALWKPLRHLSELRAVWPDLNEVQRAEISNSRAYRNRHHERLAGDTAEELLKLARGIRSIRYWRLREELISFAKNWESREPDELRVLLDMVQGQLDAGGVATTVAREAGQSPRGDRALP